MYIKNFLEKHQSDLNIYLFLEFLNDYPNQFDTVVEYLDDISKNLSLKSNHLFNLDALKSSVKKIDYTKDAWLAESLSYLIDYLETFEDLQTEIKYLLEPISNHK